MAAKYKTGKVVSSSVSRHLWICQGSIRICTDTYIRNSLAQNSTPHVSQTGSSRRHIVRYRISNVGGHRTAVESAPVERTTPTRPALRVRQIFRFLTELPPTNQCSTASSSRKFVNFLCDRWLTDPNYVGKLRLPSPPLQANCAGYTRRE